MATYNQIISGLEQIATNHRQINTFGFGDIWEIATSGDIIYPLMWADGEGVSVDIVAKTETYNFSILFMDIVKNGEINENEVLSDQLSIAKDVLAQLKHPNYPWNVSGGSLEDFTERFTDSVSGWKLSVSLILPFTSDRCVMPYEGNTSFPTLPPSGGGGGTVSGVSSIVGTAGRITVLPSSTGDVQVDIDPNYVGQTSITTLGTITTGVWNGSVISNNYTQAHSLDQVLQIGRTVDAVGTITSIDGVSELNLQNGNALLIYNGVNPVGPVYFQAQQAYAIMFHGDINATANATISATTGNQINWNDGNIVSELNLNNSNSTLRYSDSNINGNVTVNNFGVQLTYEDASDDSQLNILPTSIQFSSDNYNFTSLTPSTLPYIDASNNLVSLANAPGYLKNDGFGVLSYDNTVITGSGTLNYVPKFTPDGVTLGDSLLSESGTQLTLNGTHFLINDTVNSKLVTIQADDGTNNTRIVTTANQLEFDTAGSGLYFFRGDSKLYSNGTLALASGFASGSTSIFVYNVNGYVSVGGQGFTPNIAQLEVRGTTSNSSARAFHVADTNGSYLLDIRNDGNIGIGQLATSDGKVHIKNDGLNTVNSLVSQGSTNDSTSFTFNGFDLSGTTTFSVTSNGIVTTNSYIANTDVTTPLIIGGTAVGSFIQHKATTANGTSTGLATQFTGGNNGATTIASLYNDGQVLIGPSTLVRNPTAGGILRVGDGVANNVIDIGIISGGNSTIWLGQGTPSSTNYALIGNSTQNILNATSTLTLRINSVTRITQTATNLTFTPGASTSTIPTAFLFTGAAHTTLTAGAEVIDSQWNLARSVGHATGAITNQRSFVIQAPTHTFVGSSTITNAATLAITGAPIAGTNATITNSYSIWSQSGTVQVDGRVRIGAGTTTLEPLKFTISGSALLTTASSGSIETDPNGWIYYTPNSTDRRAMLLGGVRVDNTLSSTGLFSDTGKIINLTNTGAQTYTMPLTSAVPQGVPIYLKDAAGTAGTTAKTANRSGSDTFEGGVTSKTLTQNYEVKGFYHVGTNIWYST